eukprot:311195_1
MQKQYQCCGHKLIRGLSVSYGQKISTHRISKVSNNEFTEKELKDWKFKMKKDKKLYPQIDLLNERKSDLEIIRRSINQSKNIQISPPKTPPIAKSSKSSSLSPTSTIPPGFVPGSNGNISSPISASPPHLNNHNKMHLSKGFVGNTYTNSHMTYNGNNRSRNVPPYYHQNGNGNGHYLNSQNLEQVNIMSDTDRILAGYTKAIENGYKCFWVIPTCKGDTEYVAFLLLKNQKMVQPLQAGLDIARENGAKLGDEIEFTVIREWQIKSENDQNCKDFKGDYFKYKGYLIDCKHKTAAYNILCQLQEFVQKKKTSKSHIVRPVLREFGKKYMSIQLLPPSQRPKPVNNIKNKPQGPKFNYSAGEPTIDTMSQSSKTILIGEFDHGTITSSSSHPDDIQSVSSAHTIYSQRTETRYDDYQHMKANVFPPHQGYQPSPPQRQPQQQPPKMKPKPKPKQNQNQKPREFKVNDQVNWNGKTWTVMAVGDDCIMLTNELSGNQYV